MAADDKAKLLVERAQRGDRAAFDDLVQEFEPRLRRLIESRLGGAVRESLEVDDVLQDALLRAFRSIPSFEWRKADAFVAWLGGIVENVIRTAAQARKLRDVVALHSDVEASGSSPSRALQREERFDRLESALKSLSKDHREVIMLARIRRLRIREIAERMNRSEDAVKQLLVRALRKLKESFGETESLRLPSRRLAPGDDHE